MNKPSDFDGWMHIDWGIELDTLEFDLAAIRAHNEKNPVVKDIWTQWPIEMDGIILKEKIICLLKAIYLPKKTKLKMLK